MIYAVMAIVHMFAIFAAIGGFGYLIASLYRSYKEKRFLPAVFKSFTLFVVGVAIFSAEIYFGESIYGDHQDGASFKQASLNRRDVPLQTIYENGITVEGEVVSKELQWNITVNGRPKFAWIAYTFNDRNGTVVKGAMQIEASLLLLGNRFNKGDPVLLRYLLNDPRQNMISY